MLSGENNSPVNIRMVPSLFTLISRMLQTNTWFGTAYGTAINCELDALSSKVMCSSPIKDTTHHMIILIPNIIACAWHLGTENLKIKLGTIYNG